MSISPDRILFEDEYLLAVNKLSGELVVKGKGKVQKLPLLDFLRKDHPGLRAVHRLDFETSGVVLFAKTKEAHDRIVDAHFEGWKKVYTTLIFGVPKRQGTITKKLPARGKGFVDARTHYTVVETFPGIALVEASIETGRHHQIRRHFAMIGHPVVLDDEEGDQKSNRVFTREFGYRTFFLHASRLSLPHPISGQRISLEAPMPKQFVEVMKKLRR